MSQGLGILLPEEMLGPVERDLEFVPLGFILLELSNLGIGLGHARDLGVWGCFAAGRNRLERKPCHGNLRSLGSKTFPGEVNHVS